MEVTFTGQAPEADEVAAVLAAIMGVFASSSQPQVTSVNQDDSNWRFSGRWWNAPVVKRNRPSYLAGQSLFPDRGN